MFQIAKDKRHFENNGKNSFYLADTCWSAFTNISEADWEYYLDTRKAQGFNVIQVNMLWQWDASATTLDFLPFSKDSKGHFDFTKPNQDYFDRAERMIAAAHKRGITIALVLLWANYLPNTWASDMKIKQVGIFPKETVVDYVTTIVERYKKYHPIYIVSGDTDFQTSEVIEDYYNAALNTVKNHDKKSIAVLHIRGRESDIPDTLKNNPNLDFYMYQSGHNQAFQSSAYELAEIFYDMEPKRPVINSEPCYEMMGYSRKAYGRFSREDVRKVAWQSVLSGAFAGITYGAHGIWSWHNEQLTFDSSVGEAFETPYDWHEALKFEGAWDYGFLKHFIEKWQLFDIVPNQSLIRNGADNFVDWQLKGTSDLAVSPSSSREIRAAENNRYVIIYVPSNIKLHLAGNLSNKKMTYIDLENHRHSEASGNYFQKDKLTIINMHRFTRDAILIIEK